MEFDTRARMASTAAASESSTDRWRPLIGVPRWASIKDSASAKGIGGRCVARAETTQSTSPRSARGEGACRRWTGAGRPLWMSSREAASAKVTADTSRSPPTGRGSAQTGGAEVTHSAFPAPLDGRSPRVDIGPQGASKSPCCRANPATECSPWFRRIRATQSLARLAGVAPITGDDKLA